MKQFLYLILFVLLIDLSFQNCANPGRPSGGPKDTIPPVLINSIPLNGTTNFNGSTIELEFSEFINADKLKQQLIITPSTDITYKSIAKRNKLIIKIDGELQDSTTYNFNFANGVTDITEKNPAVNLSVAFSTGPTIDSMSIKGLVENLLDLEPQKGYVVGLYPFSDTLDYFTSKPQYFTTTNDSGKYNLQYIKTGNYKILAFSDDNGNLLLDPDTEPHGFLQDTIHLDSASEFNTIRCLLQDVKPLTLINARPTGRYVEVKFNKTINSYSIIPEIPSNIVGANKDIIRLYKPQQINFKDSVTNYISAADSLSNNVNDTIKYVFVESNRKPAGFSFTSNQANIVLQDSLIFNLTFNKPVQSFDTSQIQITYDTLFTYNPTFDYSWNSNKTKVDINLNFNEAIADSISTYVDELDSTQIDTVTNSLTSTRSFSISVDNGSFISVENDTSAVKVIPITKKPKKSNGVLKVDLNTQLESFWFQLLDSKNTVAYEIYSSTNFTMPEVKAGTYAIRILIDNNKDGKWSYGNLLLNEEPEEVFIYPEQTSIRENWVVELSISI